MELSHDDIPVHLGISASQYSPAGQHDGIREMEEAQDTYPEIYQRKFDPVLCCDTRARVGSRSQREAIV